MSMKPDHFPCSLLERISVPDVGWNWSFEEKKRERRLVIAQYSFILRPVKSKALHKG